ncbi:MAG: A/G-specific adenine glycosylase, partial [Bacteroidetes bacterium]|nr:A/G-specific adenine glycosylase [Bacteroidota bacterium]
TVCTPRSPACEQCPWQDDCQGRHLGVEETLPRKIKSKAKPTRYGMVFWLIHNNGTLLLRRRPKTGLLGGMMEFPSAPWQDSSWDLSDAIPHIPVPATDLRVLPGYVRHTFSHFHLELMVCVGRCSEIMKNGTDDLQWLGLQSLEQAALPSVMRKVAQHVLHELNADKPGTQLTTVS